VQQGMLHQLTKKYPKIQNKGVKKAPFYVLLGAEMPSILVEAGFISNLEECRRLIDPDYQDRLCQGIVEGIKRYIQEINPMATGIRKVIGEES
jgi:N-acetylmuramoyl-L-alanine amidase